MGERADDVMARHPDADDDVDVLVDDAADNDVTTAYEAADDTDDVEATRAQIEQTRAEMSETIDAIKEKLNPEVLVQQAKDSVREATIGRAQEAVSNAVDTARVAVQSVGDRARGASANMWETIRENPVPVALAGLGLGWLYMNVRRQPGHSVQRYQEYRYHHPAGSYPSSTYPAGTYPSGTYPAGSYPSSTYPAGTYPAGASMPSQPPYAGAAPEYQEGMAERVQEKAGEIAERVQETASHLGHEARERASNAGDWLQRLVSENPLPAAMAGLSLTWLCLSARNQSGTRSGDYPYRYDYSMSPGTLASGQVYSGATQNREGGVVDTARERVGEIAETARERVGEVAGTAREKVSEVAGTAREKVGEVADTAREKASAIAGTVHERVSDLGQHARLQADRAGDWFQRTLQENPLAIAGAIAGIGMLVGLLIPGTYREDRLMGETKDRLVDRARDKAQDVAGKVQTVAHEVMDTAKEQARTVAGEVMDTAREQARDQGLTPQGGTQASTSGTTASTSAMDQDLAHDMDEEETTTDTVPRGSTTTI